MQTSSGELTGFSIDLWSQVAERLGWGHRVPDHRRCARTVGRRGRRQGRCRPGRGFADRRAREVIRLLPTHPRRRAADHRPRAGHPPLGARAGRLPGPAVLANDAHLAQRRHCGQRDSRAHLLVHRTAQRQTRGVALLLPRNPAVLRVGYRIAGRQDHNDGDENVHQGTGDPVGFRRHRLHLVLLGQPQCHPDRGQTRCAYQRAGRPVWEVGRDRR